MISHSPETRWETEIARRLEQGQGLEFSRAQFAQAVDSQADDSTLLAFLDSLVNSARARRIEAYRCPMRACGKMLPAGADGTSCPYCHSDYKEQGEAPIAEHFYRLNGEISRDIRWVIVIHGMNSRAKWQEEFSWEIANRLSYSAPVLIYKYGWATIDVLARWMHRRLARNLGERIRIAIRQAEKSHRPTAPDIVVHSFGSHLLSLVLQNPAFDDLRFGRIITAASIVRPDFDWDRHIACGRIEAILNHVGDKDRAVPFAQFFIPGAGPGGRAGYLAKSTLNVRTESFGHSGFFIAENLRVLISREGLWHGFLTRPLAHFHPEGAFTPKPDWKRAPLPLRCVARLLAWTIFCALAPLSWLRRRLDP
ncbi:hypothetical protein [Pseudomonas sp. LRF_L74]|uniref:hypothetical protein n=1 Tax=Pseudomonas sp. LRF_L74 TaxID=3369422 RepID=UPI003F5DE228